MKHQRIVITGNVQGVFFRQTALRKAEEFQLKGWIQNDPAGTVTASVEGAADAVQQFTEWCRTGPPMAKVAQVFTEDLPLEHFYHFEIRRM